MLPVTDSIPKTIHFVWIGGDMPDWASRNIAEFERLNFGYRIIVHGEDSLRDEYRAVYDTLAEPCERADLIRYSALEDHGGWYFDVDYFPLRPLDDAVLAWGLDGSRVFIAEVWDSKTNPGWLGNGMIACRAGHPVWREMHEYVARAERTTRLTYGPTAIRRLYERAPESFVVAPVSWFNGVKPNWSAKLYHRAVERGDTRFLRQHDARTGGQLPFAMHLWAWKYGADLAPRRFASERKSASVLSLSPALSGVCKGGVFDSAKVGLSECGYDAEMLPYKRDALEHAKHIPDVLLMWNGAREPGKTVAAQAEAFGAVTLHVEHGFWRRTKYFQCDHAGTQHRASWASELTRPAPACGAARLAGFYPDGLQPMRARTDGYVLVLGQVPNDSQLFDSAIQTPEALQAIVRKALPSGTPAYFWPHPQCANKHIRKSNLILPLLHDGAGGAEMAAEYKRSRSGSGLDEAIRGARFVVTINSTAGNEALALGCPVLAFGPALYLSGGVARAATKATAKAEMAEMLDGWCPDSDAVRNYLEWLAARQWTREELAARDCVRGILSRAGIATPAIAREEAAG